jgi:alanine-glyoxylate transaminase/serine-glyoxylate transaminase/serine-pyruvate transaminase
MDEWGVDLAVTGSQKGLMCPAGLGILGVSQQGAGGLAPSTMRRAYFEFADMVKLNADGYFPYTPPTPLLRGLRAALDRLFREGLDEVIARHARIAEGVRRGVHAWGLDLVAEHPSLLLRHRVGHPHARGRGCPRRAAHRL